MTSIVKVNAHAGWPIQVTEIDRTSVTHSAFAGATLCVIGLVIYVIECLTLFLVWVVRTLP